MAAFQMPPDTSAKEKIVGGILDMYQLIELVIGLLIGGGLGFLLKGIFGNIGLIIGLVPGIIGGIIFIVVKIHGLTLVKYIYYRFLHKHKTHLLPNIRLEALTEEEKYEIKNEYNYEQKNVLLNKYKQEDIEDEES